MQAARRAVGVTFVLLVAASCAEGQDLAARRAAVADRGARVMPFDLDKTTHRFRPTSFGGIQTVIADNPNDEEQIRLIQMHLAEEAAAFSRGDFNDPATIHGDAMPGLATLRSDYRLIDVRYAPTNAGGRITYRTDDLKIAEALHVWFAAQLMDHGEHAEHE